MIVEFTGVPGSGKTTIIEKIYERLSLHSQNITITKISTLQTFRNLLCNSGGLQSRLVKLNQAIRDLDMPRVHRLNLYRNFVKKIAVHEQASNSPKLIHMVDEGLSHIFQNVVVGTPSNTVNTGLIQLYENLPKPDFIFIVEADDEFLIKRLKTRGHSRMIPSNIFQFLDHAKKQSLLLKKTLDDQGYTRYAVLVNSRNLDLTIDKAIDHLKNISPTINV